MEWSAWQLVGPVSPSPPWLSGWYPLANREAPCMMGRGKGRGGEGEGEREGEGRGEGRGGEGRGKGKGGENIQ